MCFRFLRNPPEVQLIPDTVIESIGHLKKDILGRKRVSLDVEEALTAHGEDLRAQGLPTAAEVADGILVRKFAEDYIIWIEESNRWLQVKGPAYLVIENYLKEIVRHVSISPCGYAFNEETIRNFKLKCNEQGNSKILQRQ